MDGGQEEAPDRFPGEAEGDEASLPQEVIPPARDKALRQILLPQPGIAARVQPPGHLLRRVVAGGGSVEKVHQFPRHSAVCHPIRRSLYPAVRCPVRFSRYAAVHCPIRFSLLFHDICLPREGIPQKSGSSFPYGERGVILPLLTGKSSLTPPIISVFSSVCKTAPG